MQLKITACLILFTLGVKSLPQKGHCDCEEEVWEEVLCDSILDDTPTVAPAPTTAATTPMSTRPTKTTKQTSPASTPSPASSCPITDPYKKCYCECKSGCKELCRKVVLSPAQKQILQVSQLTEPFGKGSIKLAQILQRELAPSADQPSINAIGNYAASYTDESETEDYTMPQSYPFLPAAGSRNEGPEIEPEPFHVPYYEKTNVASENYLAKPVVLVLQPSHGAQQPSYYSLPYSNAAAYNYAMPLENAYPKVTRSVRDPARGLKPLPLDDSTSKISTTGRKSGGSGETFDQYDVSLEAILRNFVHSDPSNPAPYYTLRPKST